MPVTFTCELNLRRHNDYCCSGEWRITNCDFFSMPLFFSYEPVQHRRTDGQHLQYGLLGFTTTA